MESLAPYPNLTLRPDTVDEFCSLFENLDYSGLKKAFQSAMLDSQDFFPAPGKIMSHYKGLMNLEPKVTCERHYSESADNITCTLTVTTSGTDDKGRPYTDKREYVELTQDALFKTQLENYKKGLVKVINKNLPTRITYGWELESVVKKDPAFKFLGYLKRFGESLPVYQHI
jgi:hypothetical protein